MDQQTLPRSHWNTDLQVAETLAWRFAGEWQQDMTGSYAVAAVVIDVLAEYEEFGMALLPPDNGMDPRQVVGLRHDLAAGVEGPQTHQKGFHLVPVQGLVLRKDLEPVPQKDCSPVPL